MYDYNKYAVLYVDDEEQSLKYFRKAFEKEFWVLTALSAEEARDILDQEKSRVGLLITDQRMPRQSGVDLLAHVRRSRPNIVRILTTAYADLDSAIEAVNSGAIFKYVVKPWNLQELRGALLRGMGFFLVQQERDTLLRERLSILRRLMIADRVRSLAVLAAGLSHHIRNPMTALKTFLDLTPEMLEKELPEQAQVKSPEFWRDLWSVAQDEIQRILQMIDGVARAVFEPSIHFENQLSLHDLVTKAVESLKEETDTWTVSLHMDIAPDMPPFKANATMMERLIKILLKQAIRLSSNEGNLTLRARKSLPVWGTEGAKVIVTRDGPPWDENQVGSLFTPFSLKRDSLRDPGLGLLPAFFIAHHHGGDIMVHYGPPYGPGFEVLLPFDPEAAKRPTLEQDCFKKIMTHFEKWDRFWGDF